MASRRIDTDIDRLYQLPPDEFTSARNLLARNAGTDAADVRRLAKPPIAAWAVNQVYWKRRDIYDALVDTSTELRKTHTAILAGRRADLRDASKAHEEALDAALKGALAILQEEGHPATDVTRQALLTTLRALPSDEPPGRLTRTLQPGGFEMLAGLSIGGAKAIKTNFRLKAEATTSVSRKAEATTSASGKAEATKKAEATRSKAEVAKAEAAKAAAAKAVRIAEQAAGRAEFEAVRTTREAEKAARQLEDAREALEAAKQALDVAKAAAATTARARDAAERQSREAERALDAARRVLRSAGGS